MEISQRLQAVAQFVTGPVVADIGTDHGYIPIYLVQTGKAKKVIAADVRPGPLARAREHIAQYGLNASIETRLGSGLSVLSPGEVQTVVVSGLGGMLLCSLLEEGAAVVASVKQLVLQPQLDVPAVRDAGHRCGFAICQEQMVYEEGKFYTVLDCIRGEEAPYNKAELRFGRRNIEKRCPVLREYLRYLWQQTKKQRRFAAQGQTDRAIARQRELEAEQNFLQEVFSCYEGQSIDGDLGSLGSTEPGGKLG